MHNSSVAAGSSSKFVVSTESLMIARGYSVSVLCFTIAVAENLSSANAQAPSVFGLQNIVIAPPSGAATPASLIRVDVSGVAPDALTPQEVTLSHTGPGTIEILLTAPNVAAVQVPTPWATADVAIPIANLVARPQPIQLPAGVYDFYARGVVGLGTPNERQLGFEQVVNDFVVIPEPSAWFIALTTLSLITARRLATAPRSMTIAAT
jgi:hypothetical protein